MSYWEVLRKLSLYQDPPEEGEDPPEGGGGSGEGDDPPKGSEPSGSVEIDGEMIPRSALPEQLRDRPVQEVRFLLNRLAEGVSQRNNEVQTLREQLAELRGKLESTPAKPEEPDPYEEMSDEELLVEDADAAILRVLKRNGLLDRFGEVQSRLDETEFAVVASRIDDFEEYEEDVRGILKETGARPTRDNILGAYTMAVGERTLKEKQRQMRKQASMEPSKPEPPEEKDGDLPELTGLEAEIFAASGMTREEWEEYRADKPIDIKVPTSP